MLAVVYFLTVYWDFMNPFMQLHYILTVDGLLSSVFWLVTVIAINACVWLVTVLWCCWLGGRKGIRPVKNRECGCWHCYLSGVRCRLAYGPADATTTQWHSLSLASVKSRLVLPFWYQITLVVTEKGPLNWCVCLALDFWRHCDRFSYCHSHNNKCMCLTIANLHIFALNHWMYLYSLCTSGLWITSCLHLMARYWQR